MLQAILFDLFETLITESQTRPGGMSALAPQLGCERELFRREWKALRPAAITGRVTLRQALSHIGTKAGSEVDDIAVQRLCNERIRRKAEPFERVEHEIVMLIDYLRSRNLRLGVISNCLAEDVAGWDRCSLASRFDCAAFSFDVGLAKPDPAIYIEATRRLQVDASQTWFIGDGGSDELTGAMQAGLLAFRALWFLRRWPHFREERSPCPSVNTIHEVISLVEQVIGPRERGSRPRRS
jgi:putative hydrolase of the HAD superfamily